MKTVFVKCNSHRAREKLQRLIDHKINSYYNLAVAYHIYEIFENELDGALKITGVTKGKKIDIVKDGYTFKFMLTFSMEK